MGIEIGLSNCVFGKRPPVEDDFRQMHDFNIRHMEISLLRGWLDPHAKNTIADVCRWLEKYDLQALSVHGPSGMPVQGHWLADPDDAVRRQNIVERRLVLEGAKAFGAKYMIVEYECYDRWPFWPHNSPVEFSYPHAHELWKRSMDELVTDADRAGVKIAVENIDGLPHDTMARTVAEWPADVVGICFDSSHATYGDTFFEQLDCFKNRIIGTHLSDNDALPGIEWQDRHWFPFQGVINWERIAETLAAVKTCPILIVEPLTPDHKITPPLAESLEKLRSLIARKGKLLAGRTMCGSN